LQPCRLREPGANDGPRKYGQRQTDLGDRRCRKALGTRERSPTALLWCGYPDRFGRRPARPSISTWCRWSGSNRHSFRNTILSRARLPIPPHRPDAVIASPHRRANEKQWRAVRVPPSGFDRAFAVFEAWVFGQPARTFRCLAECPPLGGPCAPPL
jgi:hypothetical protein